MNGTYWLGALVGAAIEGVLLDPARVPPDLGWRLGLLTGPAIVVAVWGLRRALPESPRRLLTRFMGWFSQVEQPWVRDASIGLWRFFSDLDLSEAKKSHFRSMHDCFIRELKDGARPIDRNPAILVSPCDAIVGACGASFSSHSS